MWLQWIYKKLFLSLSSAAPFLLWLSPLGAVDSTGSIPRVLIALYNGQQERGIKDGLVAGFAEMPLNHLGFICEYHDVQAPLPEIAQRADVAGVITGFTPGLRVSNALELVDWQLAAMEAGKRMIVLGEAFSSDQSILSDEERRGRFWRALGLQDTGMWEREGVAIEVRYANLYWNRPGSSLLRESTGDFLNLRPLDSSMKLFAWGQSKQDKREHAALACAGPNGGYLARGYAFSSQYRYERQEKHWHIDPFAFFRAAMGLGNTPVADTTTLAGRRIFYSHIDGDGWNNLSTVPGYYDRMALCAEVIKEEVLEAFPDLPCSVGPIAADVNLSWVGTERSRQSAREILALSNIEAAVHTLSHPFEWRFFANYQPKDEIPFFSKYPDGGWKKKSFMDRVKMYTKRLMGTEDPEHFYYPQKDINDDYEIPRAFALKKFTVHSEIIGAIKDINLLCPERKTVQIYLWSGDCYPFEQAIALTRKAHVRNMNGGDTRFDSAFPSYAWVAPLMRQVGTQRQIYSSNSNENTYTGLWSKHFYGFNKLPETWHNTDLPIRVKPMNLYYHMYSGEKIASLHALLENVHTARAQNPIPITASHFAQMIDDFCDYQLLPVDGAWSLKNRGNLQTLRLDQATYQTVDFTRSEGVVGQRHLHGSLYVYLDEANEQPIVAFQAIIDASQEPLAAQPYLIESRWQIKQLEHEPDSTSFVAKGFGKGEMTWRVEAGAEFEVISEGVMRRLQASPNGILRFSLPEDGVLVPHFVQLKRRA